MWNMQVLADCPFHKQAETSNILYLHQQMDIGVEDKTVISVCILLFQ